MEELRNWAYSRQPRKLSIVTYLACEILRNLANLENHLMENYVFFANSSSNWAYVLLLFREIIEIRGNRIKIKKYFYKYVDLEIFEVIFC